jgi:hypothetical protein
MWISRAAETQASEWLITKGYRALVSRIAVRSNAG